MRLSNEERAFAVEAYFSNRQSVVATQCTFRNRFNVAPRGPVPDRKSIVTWVTTFRQMGVRDDEELEYLGPSDHL
ncbi:Transposable element Tc3 transposase [Caligus rogercresseyi]|uniref:Transposable element Tc3 transposase n=1 Tax=Caligus rogercresseyi TaxID=217165 RepID=A0A7T8HFJ4_CALRO|nr:Transposable element Tc3 transposase [Caligus rogercresseyi]